MVEKGVIFEGQAKMENLDKAAFGTAKPAGTTTTAPAPAVSAVKG